MRFFTVAVILLASFSDVITTTVVREKYGLPVVYDYKNGEKCPAKNFFIDCVLCICSKDGDSAICGRITVCPTHQIEKDTDTENIPHIDFFEQIGECTPDDYFYDKCNMCHCDPDGHGASCTLKECMTPQKPHIDGYKQGKKCPPGKTFYNNCNSCVCGKDGNSAVCTLVEC